MLIKHGIEDLFLSLGEIPLVPSNNLIVGLSYCHNLTSNNKRCTLRGVRAALNKVTTLNAIKVRNQPCTICAAVLLESNGDILHNNVGATHTAGLATETSNRLCCFFAVQAQAFNL